MSQSPNSDDDYQIEVAVAPKVQPRRPRTPNPAVDEAIQSGEIELPRSLIIRSSAPSPLGADRDDRTEPRRPPVVASAPSRSRFGRVAWLVAAIAPAIAAIVLHYAEPSTAPTVQAAESAELTELAQLLGTTIDGATHAAQLRADALASSPMLRAGIQTDAATLADMAKDQDIVLSLAPHERVEVFQTGDHPPVSLLRLPAGASAIDASGVKLALVDGKTLTTIVTAPITKAGGAQIGLIALASPIDLAVPKLHQLSAVTITGFAQPLVLGGGPAANPGSKAEAPIHLATKEPALQIHATLAAAPVLATDHLMAYARYACAALAILFLLMYLASVIFRR